MLPLIYNTINNVSAPNGLLETNGFGFLINCEKFIVTQEKHGAYNFTAKIKKNDPLKSYIKLGAYIKAKVNNSDSPQLFYIAKIDIDKYGDYSISGEHVSRLLLQNGTIPSVSTSESILGTPNEIFTKLWKIPSTGELMIWFTEHPYDFFSFSSGITDKKEISLGYNSAEKFENIFFDEADGFASVFNGFFSFNNFSVTFNKLSNSINNIRIAFGSNVSDYNQTTAYGEYFTHIMPFAICEMTDEDGKETIGQKTITPIQPYKTGLKCPVKRTYVLDCTSQIKKYVINPYIGSNINAVKSELAKQVKKYLNENEQNAESMSITVTVEPELLKLGKLKLHDLVTIVMPDNGEIQKRIVKTVYDSVSEKYKEIGIGDLNVKISDLLKIQRRYKK